MKKSIFALLLAALVALIPAFAGAEEELLQAIQENEGNYEAGSPLTEADFILYSTDPDLANAGNDALSLLPPGNFMCLYSNPSGEDDFCYYSHRGIRLLTPKPDNADVEPSLYSREGVLQKYGAGVSGAFDPQTDELYRAGAAQGWQDIDIMQQAVSWTFYNFETTGQIKFYFDENGSIVVMYYFNGIWAVADRETTKTVQEYLNAQGYDCGTPDGVAGKKTSAALTQYQEDNGLFPSGIIDDALMKHLEGRL